MRFAPALALLILLPACGDGPPIPGEDDLSLTLSPDTVEVRPGEPFDLKVIRVWRRDLRPEPFLDHVLSPLEVKLVETVRREDEHRVEETRHYRANALTLEDVSIPAPVFRARSPSALGVLSVSGNQVVVRVRCALDPQAPGEAEFPDGPLAGGSSWLVPGILLALAGAGLALFFLRAHRRPASVDVAPVEAADPEGPPPPGPRELALDGLSRLRDDVPKDRDGMVAQHAEAARILRDYLVAGLGLRAIEMTTEECLASPKLATTRPILAESLSRCDLVKFAGFVPDLLERGRMLDAAENFVRIGSPRAEGE